MRASEFTNFTYKTEPYEGWNGDGLVVRAYDDKTEVGHVIFEPTENDNTQWYAVDVEVEEPYQRKGIATKMYDIAKKSAKQQGAIIVKSHTQTDAGRGLWQDKKVWEQQNLSEVAKSVKVNGLMLKYAFNESALIMKAYEQGTPIAYVKFVKEDKELYPQDLWVHDDHRNRGIAKTMYDALKKDGYIINRSHDQTKAGAGFWDKHRGEDSYVWEEVIDEMPLPADWDPQQMRQQGTSFKSRLAYALERAKKLGTGSSRVATTIEYEGRPTVLKIAKNQKGLAQNSVEADILSDGYASQLGILIPIIDYDEQNREPSWVHTEMAQKASEKQLANMMGVDDLNDIVQMGRAIAGKSKMIKHQDIVNYMRTQGKTEEQIETATEYGNILADLANSFDVELSDFARKANWGLYKGKPVIVDVGFNSNVLDQYYKR